MGRTCAVPASAGPTNGNGNGSYPATEAPEEISDEPEGYPKPE